MGGTAGPCPLSSRRLEVDASYELADAPAGIVRRRDVAIGSRHLAHVRLAAVAAVGLKIDTVEGVQKFGAELELNALGDSRPLDHAEIPTRERDPRDDEPARGTLLSLVDLNAILAGRGRDVPACGHSVGGAVPRGLRHVRVGMHTLVRMSCTPSQTAVSCDRSSRRLRAGAL